MSLIYKITNDINGKVYIGKTEFSLEKRFAEHCKAAYKRCCEHRPLYAAMRKYSIEHFHIELVEETDNPEEREMYWIQQYDSYTNGYNATLGGDSRRYIDRDRVIEVYRRLGNQAQTARELGIDRASVRKILVKKQEDRLSSNDVILRSQGKPVFMFSREGVLLREFDSINSAAHCIASQDTSRTNINGICEHIRGVCNGKRKTAYGYLWRFQDKTVIPSSILQSIAI